MATHVVRHVVRHACEPRAGMTLGVAGGCPKGALWMALCMACAQLSLPMLNGLWRTCGLMRRTGRSVQMNAIQRHTFGVDKNLYGVSPRVTESGVLVCGRVFSR